MSGIVGIDVGGTFTDLYFSGNAERPHLILKVPSTPKDPSIGLLNALQAAGLTADELDAILHGTTIATNAVIERRGAVCALITTAGFRDILELGRRDRPNTYGLEGTHEPLIPRDLRFEVNERLDHEGNELVALDVAGLRAIGGGAVKTVRGRGLMIAVELHPEAGGARAYCKAMQARGVLCKETHDHTIRIAPPLVITADQVDWALEQFGAVLAG